LPWASLKTQTPTLIHIETCFSFLLHLEFSLF
jgi:hypothetical protein